MTIFNTISCDKGIPNSLNLFFAFVLPPDFKKIFIVDKEAPFYRITDFMFAGKMVHEKSII